MIGLRWKHNDYRRFGRTPPEKRIAELLHWNWKLQQ
jgi:hypothetical protein